VTAPIDLTRKFGEGWCVTLARLPADDALRHMGVEGPTDMPDGLAQATHRLTTRNNSDEPSVLLLAREAAPGWTLVLELEGTIGWIGMDPDVLGDLSADGGTACTIMRDPNQFVAMFAEDGHTTAGLDAVTGRRWGTPSDQLAAALAGTGLPENDDDEPADEIAHWSFSQYTVLALHAATGIQLHDEMFHNPWRGGSVH